MEWETFLYAIALLVAGALIFLQVFELILFADLESDYINPIDLCNRVNMFILPEFVSHAVLTTLFLFSGFWFEFLTNIPLVIWHAFNFTSKSLQLDATSIFSRLDSEKKRSYIKVAFYLIWFFVYLYKLIYCMVRDVVGTPQGEQMLRSLI